MADDLNDRQHHKTLVVKCVKVTAYTEMCREVWLQRVMSAITVKGDMCAWGGIFLKSVFEAEGTMWENTLVRTVLALLLLAAKHGELKTL